MIPENQWATRLGSLQMTSRATCGGSAARSPVVARTPFYCKTRSHSFEFLTLPIVTEAG